MNKRHSFVPESKQEIKKIEETENSRAAGLNIFLEILFSNFFSSKQLKKSKSLGNNCFLFVTTFLLIQLKSKNSIEKGVIKMLAVYVQR